MKSRSTSKFYITQKEGSQISIKKSLTEIIGWKHGIEVVIEYDSDTDTLTITPLDKVKI